MTEPVWPFRPQAVAAYRHGEPAKASHAPPRPARWPLVALGVLIVTSLAFAMSIRVPRMVTGTVIDTSASSVMVLVPGQVTPLPVKGAATTIGGRDGHPDLRVVRAEVVNDEAGARRWRIPVTVHRPVTIVLLNGTAKQAVGQINIQVADPTLLQALPGLGGVKR